MARPYFSIVIDNYNYGRFLGQCVQSCLDQDFPAAEREVIIVDDGSTDESVAVASGFGDKIRLIRQKNQKQAGAFKAGFAAAQGEVVCLLDSDDYCHPKKLERFAERLKDPSVGIVQHHLRDVDISGKPLHNPLPRWPDVYTLEDFLAGRCENAATSGLAFRRSVLDQVLPVPPEVFCWYDEYLIAHAIFGTRVANINEVLGYHRMHGANNWANRMHNPDQLESHVREGRAFYRFLEPKLAAAGRRLNPHFESMIELDFKRRELLVAAHRGQRALAWRIWRDIAARHGATGFGLFKSATLALALVHPSVYLWFYKVYSSDQTFRKLRSKLMPDPASSEAGAGR